MLGGGDAASADASFSLKNASSTNLLSFDDVHGSCATVAGATTGTFVMTCKESNTNGACRTVTVIFGGAPATGRTYAAVAKAVPADGEAVVEYQESIDCTPATTNGWVE